MQFDDFLTHKLNHPYSRFFTMKQISMKRVVLGGGGGGGGGGDYHCALVW